MKSALRKTARATIIPNDAVVRLLRLASHRDQLVHGGLDEGVWEFVGALRCLPAQCGLHPVRLTAA
jgi:hypothetical protein